MTHQVWILNHYALEPGGAGGTRHFSLAAALKQHGWNASLIAASVELNTNRQRLEAGETHRLETHEGVDFLWLNVPTHVGNGVGRMRNMLTYAWRAMRRKSVRQLPKPDLIIGSTVHPFAAVAGALLARRYRVPFFYEVRDLWPQTLIDLGRLTETSLMTKVMRAMERWLFRRADRIITLLPHVSDYTTPLGISPDKLLWVPNGVVLGEAPEPPMQRVAIEPFTFMYFGAHGQANGLDNVLRAMAELGNNVCLRLIGDGPDKPALQALAGELGLDTVSFEDPVPKQAIPALAAEADAFVFNLVNAPVFRFGISSNKLFDFLAAARPVVFACEASNNPVDEAGAGITVPPGDPKALAAAMKAVAAMSFEERTRVGQAGRDWVAAHHGFNELAAKLAKAMDVAIEPQPP